MPPADESKSPRTQADSGLGHELLPTFVSDCTPTAPPEDVHTVARSQFAARRSSVLSSPHARFSVPGFEILAELGRGGVGIVFKARQVALNRLVALKELIGDGREDDRATIRFLAEA